MSKNDTSRGYTDAPAQTHYAHAPSEHHVTERSMREMDARRVAHEVERRVGEHERRHTEPAMRHVDRLGKLFISFQFSWLCLHFWIVNFSFYR